MGWSLDQRGDRKGGAGGSRSLGRAPEVLFCPWASWPPGPEELSSATPSTRMLGLTSGPELEAADRVLKP